MYGEFLKRLLAPLGVYDLSAGTRNEAEVYALGTELDRIAARLETAERESVAATAEDEGLTLREDLFARRPAAATTAERRAAIAALLQIDGDSLTPAALNRTLRGCGIAAEAAERGGGRLRVTFPGSVGEPPEFDRIRAIVLDILPCHLETEFYFRFLTWAECEAAAWTFAAVESAEHTWQSFQMAVPAET